MDNVTVVMIAFANFKYSVFGKDQIENASISPLRKTLKPLDKNVPLSQRITPKKSYETKSRAETSNSSKENIQDKKTKTFSGNQTLKAVQFKRFEFLDHN